MTLKRLSIVAAATLALSSSALAAGHWGVGATVYMNQLSSSALTATYMNDQFLTQLGLGYHKTTTAGTSSTTTTAISSHLRFGLRNMMSNNVSLDYGVAGSYDFTNYPTGSTSKDPYMVGAFVGVDYTLGNNVLLTAAIQPYSYSRDASNTKHTKLFDSGSIGVSYLFG